MRQPVIEMEDVRVSFQSFEGTARVLDGISLTLFSGERLAVVGESGCGKSLTARVAMGLIRDRDARVTGRLVIDGAEMGNAPESAWRTVRGRKVSMIYQDPGTALNPVFDIASQMTEVLLATAAAPSRREAVALARERLHSVGIHDTNRVMRSYPFELSGGMAQRVIIAMGLAAYPKAVLADEPGASLDVTVQSLTLDLLARLGSEEGCSVLIITHNLGVVRQFAERMLVMYAGKIVESGPTAELFRDPLHPYTRALLQAVPRLIGSQLPEPIDGVVPSYFGIGRGCRFASRCKQAMEMCHRESPARVTVQGSHTVACFLHSDEVEPAMDVPQ